jgi:hypothetical protein
LPVPFQDVDDGPDLGLAGYLRFQKEQDGKGMRAALFSIASRGEPIEFSFSRMDVSASFLWRPGDANRHAVASLCKTLFRACSRQPVLLLALAEEVPPQVFTEDLKVSVPICRVSTYDETVQASNETLEVLSDAVNLFWIESAPSQDSPDRRLLEALRARNMLTEPFERALVGLDEAFKDS